MPHAAGRPLKPAMLRGALGRCPACGQGRMFGGYLKVLPSCRNCGEELHHQRADDGPAYLTILLVSHLGAPLLLAIFMLYRPSAMSMLISFSLGAIILSLLLLPRIKGGFIGFQWARRMHGFGDEPHTPIEAQTS
ncbi:zinc-finger protein [Paracoccus halophilus]|nr:zinc-finger protein [Paracoccus halophilus]